MCGSGCRYKSLRLIVSDRSDRGNRPQEVGAWPRRMDDAHQGRLAGDDASRGQAAPRAPSNVGEPLARSSERAPDCQAWARARQVERLEQRCNRWKQQALSTGLPDLTEANSHLLLRFVLDMEGGDRQGTTRPGICQG
jgi:hypothetical protein